ncbi:MAG: hypothetical protein AAFN70_07700, partial [Planctomycetota bacterium]
HAISGRDGRQIWQSSVESSNGKAIAGNGDFNGDGVDDHCSWRTYIGLGGTTQLVLTGISGRTGTSLWTTQFPVSNRGSHLHAVCSDIDRDGTNELLLTVYDQVGGNNRAVRLHCLHTMNGRKKWDSLASADGNSSLFSSDKIDQWPIHLLDLSGDGNQEVVIPLQDIPGEPLAAVWDASGNPLPQTPLGDYSIVPTQRPWLSRVLSMRQTQTGKPTLRHQFVVPDFELNAATGVSRVSCNWFDISSGRHISHWSADGRLNDYRPINDFAPGIAQGTPFLIRAGDVDYTGLCIMDRRAGGVQIVVLDSSQTDVEEIQRVEIGMPVGFRDFNDGASAKIAILDVDQDGYDEAVFHQQNALLARTLATGRTVRRRERPDLGPAMQDYEITGYDMASRQLQLLTRYPGEQRMELIDLDRFALKWDIPLPPATETVLLNVANPSATQNDAWRRELPVILVSGDATRTITATPHDFVGGDHDSGELPDPSNTWQNPTGQRTSIPSGTDPRMLQPLPWSMGAYSNSSTRSNIALVTNSLGVALGTFLWPFLFLRYLMKHRQWSLQVFMLLPLVVLVPYLAFQLPMEHGLQSPAHEFSRGHGVPLWIGKLFIAASTLPVIVFLHAMLASWWLGRWRSLSAILSCTVVVAVLIGALALVGQYGQLPEGTRYQIMDWG